MIPPTHQRFDGDNIVTAAVSEAEIAANADAALTYLRRHDALDLAPMLGLTEAAS